MATYIPPNTPSAGEDIERGFSMFMSGLQHRQKKAKQLFDMGFDIHDKAMMQEGSLLAGSKRGAYPEVAKTKLANMVVNSPDAADRKANEKQISSLGKTVTNFIAGAKGLYNRMTGPGQQDRQAPTDLSQRPTQFSAYNEPSPQYAMEGVGEPGGKMSPNVTTMANQGWAYQPPTEIQGGGKAVASKASPWQTGRDVRKPSTATFENYPEDTNIARIQVEQKVSDEDATKLARELQRYDSKIKQDPSYAGKIAKALNISPEAIPVAYQKIQQPAPPGVGSTSVPRNEPQSESIPTMDDIFNESKQGADGKLADGLNILRRRFQEEIQRNPRVAAEKAMDYMSLEDQLHLYYGSSAQTSIISNLSKNLGRKLPAGGGGRGGKEDYWYNEDTGQRIDNAPKNPDGTYVKGWRKMTPAVEQRYAEDLRRTVDSEDASEEVKNDAYIKLEALKGGPEGLRKFLMDAVESSGQLNDITSKYAGTPFEKLFPERLMPDVDTRVASNETKYIPARRGDSIAEENGKFYIIRDGKNIGPASPDDVKRAKTKGKK